MVLKVNLWGFDPKRIISYQMWRSMCLSNLLPIVVSEPMIRFWWPGSDEYILPWSGEPSRWPVADCRINHERQRARDAQCWLWWSAHGVLEDKKAYAEGGEGDHSHLFEGVRCDTNKVPHRLKEETDMSLYIYIYIYIHRYLHWKEVFWDGIKSKFVFNPKRTISY